MSWLWLFTFIRSLISTGGQESITNPRSRVPMLWSRNLPSIAAGNAPDLVSNTGKTCRFTGKCSWCQKEGHKEAVCKQGVASKPKLMTSVVGGKPVQIYLQWKTSRLKLTLSEDVSIFPPPPNPGHMIVQKFLADTGANKSFDSNPRSASTYCGQPMDIGTAAGCESLKSEVGKFNFWLPPQPCCRVWPRNFVPKFGRNIRKRGSAL